MGNASNVTGAAWEKQFDHLAQLYGWRIASFRRVQVRRRDGSVYHATPVGHDGKGWPDRVLLRRERILFVELKAGSGRLRKNQREWRDALLETGQSWHLFEPDDLAAVVALLR